MVGNKLLNGLVRPAAVYEVHKTLSILALIVGSSTPSFYWAIRI